MPRKTESDEPFFDPVIEIARRVLESGAVGISEVRLLQDHIRDLEEENRNLKRILEDRGER